MLVKITNLNKSIGSKDLFNELSLSINEGEKVALIGRNGLGKTSLFRIVAGEDKDFTGVIELKKETRIIMTQQEHHTQNPEITALDYILNDAYLYRDLKARLSVDPETLGEDMDKIQDYSDAVMHFSELGYYEIEDKIISSLEDFGVNMEKALGPLRQLSGGEKRFVELVRVMFSNSNLVLIDEPTNHMDYVGKQKFIDWLIHDSGKGFMEDSAMILITHDRDVLKHVDRIIELRDKKMTSFVGNYDAYLKQNSIKTVSSIAEYEISLKRLEKLESQIREARVTKIQSFNQSARIREERFQKEYDDIKANLKKPSFWIDEESKELMSDKVVDKYEKYKEKNINILKNNDREHKKELLKITNLFVGYEHPLFKNIHFNLNHGDRFMIKGRNGAGKTTLIKTILNQFDNNKYSSKSTIFSGEIKFNVGVRIGLYEQEISEVFLKSTLSDAIYKVYEEAKIEINDRKVKGLLNQYLFDPMTDGERKIEILSGGQKARFQIIKMLVNNPNLLILDEPTNHLDLPSIEELEKSLQEYHGAILYITHDTYLMEKLGGEVVLI